MAGITPNLGLQLLDPSQAQPEVPINDNLNKIDAALGTQALTVATLPATPATGQRAFVTDATAGVFLSIVAGGGAIKTPVTFDGANWVVG
jgi:hypothetical protein